MARTQSVNYFEIRTGLLRQAAQLFARRGYARTSIADLTRASASSRGTLYHYFDSKEAILKEILGRHVADMGHRVSAAIALSDNGMQQLRNISRAMTTLNAESRNEQIVLMNELGNLKKSDQAEIRSMQNHIVDMVLGTLRKLDRGRRLTPRNRKAYTMLFLGMINFTYAWYDPKGPVAPRELADMAADILLDGFIGHAS
jgi:AcrR family transcriptional regulator